MLLPWPSREQRQADISAARSQKEVSQAGAAHAALIERDIDRIRHENHFASLIADQFRRGHGNGTAR
jgi:hypothetical protein